MRVLGVIGAGVLAAAVAAKADVPSAAGTVKTFWFMPGAKDGDGSERSPFGSLDAVKSAVRAAVKDASLPDGAVHVVVPEGEYFLPSTLVLKGVDSGTASRPVVWRAARRGGVRFTGGVPVPVAEPLRQDDPNFARIPAEARGHVMAADLKAAGITGYGRVRTRGLGGSYMELVWAGRLQTLARWPNDGYTGIAAVEPTEKGPNGKLIPAKWFVAKDRRVASWADESAPCGNGFFHYNWSAERVSFEKIDPVSLKITQKGSGSRYGYSKRGFWFGFNLLCELDSPGEYYIDRKRGRLYFWPPCEGEGVLTVTSDLAMLSSVSNVVFDGFVFENCRGIAFRAHKADGVRLVACTFRNIGEKAVEMRDVWRSKVSGCDVSWCGSGGVSMRGGEPDALERSGSCVENCHIHHYAVSDLTYAPAVSVTGCGLAVRHCTIHDGPHGAVLFSGREHEISWNEIHSVLLECGEMGVVYCGRDWTLCGTSIRANYIHDIYNPRSQYNRGVMLDDGAAGISIVSNRFERLPVGVSLSGIGNLVANNLFVSNFPPVRACQKWEFHSDYTNTSYTHQIMLEKLAKLPVHDEPWKSRYPYLALVDDAIKNGEMRAPLTRTRVVCNWSTTPPSIVKNFSDSPCADFVWHPLEKWAYSPKCWVEEGNVVGAEPPAGFAPLPPVEAIGVQNGPDRATWPISHPVTVKSSRLVLGRK